MVLGWRRPGRVGRCRIFLTTKSISSHHIFSHARQQRGKPTPVGRCRKSDERSGSKRAASYYRESKTTIPAKGEIILLSSVGSSERLLTARSLVRVQQGEPQKREHQLRCSLFCAIPLLGTTTVSIYGNWCASLLANLAKEEVKDFLVYVQIIAIM